VARPQDLRISNPLSSTVTCTEPTKSFGTWPGVGSILGFLTLYGSYEYGP